ncbi:type IV pilin protein [Marinobacterium rhizophilum]|uniref:type IV pilin protein n=1 Tax=Marinobacterium rhizophilum TaxID=420402 RepID=UPI000373F3F6|nr:type IV pilin protein [Marinobacterium rhizophilum]
MKDRAQGGFTLIELMIVVVVVAILTTLAYPSYMDYVRKSRRSDAMNALASVRIEQEKWRANNVSFTTNLSSLGLLSVSTEGYYTIAIPAATASSFAATATPQGAQVGDNCGTFAADRNGPDYTGTNADADCWER